MNSVQEFNRYPQGNAIPVPLAQPVQPRRSLETGIALPPAFSASPRFAPNPEYAAFNSVAANSGGFLGGITPEQQALAARLAAAGYRLDDSRLNKIDDLMNQERAAKEGLMYAGVGLMQMQTGDPLYEWGTAQSKTAANNIVKFIENKAPDQVARYNKAATETSYRRAGLDFKTGQLLDVKERTGLPGLWNRLRPGIQLGLEDVLDDNGQVVRQGHTSIMNSAKQQLLEELRPKNPHLPTELLEQLPEARLTTSGRAVQHVKNAARPVVEPLVNTAKDIKSTVGDYINQVRGINNSVTNNLTAPPPPPATGAPAVTTNTTAPPVTTNTTINASTGASVTATAGSTVANTTTNTVTNATANAVITETSEALATTASSTANAAATNTATTVATTVGTEVTEAAGQGLLNSFKRVPWKDVGTKSLGVVGAGIAVYQVGSNAIENYKAGDYRNVVKDVAGQATGLAVSSVVAGALTPVAAGGLLAASAALTATGVLAPVGVALAWATPVLAPLVAGVAGGIVGQVATEATKWGLDPLLKWAGFKNSSDKARDEIKQNRELLTNIATGTSTAITKGVGLPRQATEGVPTTGSNPSLFAQAPSNRGTQFNNVYNF